MATKNTKTIAKRKPLGRKAAPSKPARKPASPKPAARKAAAPGPAVKVKKETPTVAPQNSPTDSSPAAEEAPAADEAPMASQPTADDVHDKRIAAAPIWKKLKERGFVKDGRDELCDACQHWTRGVYRLQSRRIGGRDLEWCWWCGLARSWRCPVGQPRVEEAHFDLQAFLS